MSEKHYKEENRAAAISSIALSVAFGFWVESFWAGVFVFALTFFIDSMGTKLALSMGGKVYRG